MPVFLTLNIKHDSLDTLIVYRKLTVKPLLTKEKLKEKVLGKLVRIIKVIRLIREQEMN
jgi:hypothetical protein